MNIKLKQNGSILSVLAVLAVLALIVYGMYLQAGGHGDIFQALFHSVRNMCETTGNHLVNGTCVN